MYWHGPLLAIAMASVITTSAGQSVHIAPAGDDANPGTADAPVQSLARLGEIIGERTDLTEVVLHEGVYRGWLPIKGPKDLSPEDLPPLLVRPAPGAEVTLDGAQPLGGAEPLDGAPGAYVVRDRKRYQSDGARADGITPRMWDRVARLRYELVADVRAVAALEGSFAVTRAAIRNCKVWNDFWGTWRFGDAVVAWSSPHLAAERNLIFLNQHGLVLHESPSARLVHNTFLKHMQGAVLFIESVRGSVLRNNCMTFNGNRAFMLRVKHIDELASFNSDYNNLGTKLRYWKPLPGAVPNLASKPKFLGSSKTLVSVNSSGEPIRGEKYAWRLGEEGAREGRTRVWLRQIETWRRFSGNDAHSIFAHARHHNVAELDFELDPDSPNIGAAEHGKTIGAMGVRQAD